MSQQSKEIVYAVSLYIGVAIIMVLVNKSVLSAVPSLPLSFLWLQILVAVVLLVGAKTLNLIALPDIEFNTCKRLAWLMVLNCVGLSLNTLTLKWVDASVYQIARSLTLPFTVILTPIVIRSTPLNQRYPSKGILLALGLVILGFIAGTSLDRNNAAARVSFWGIVYGVASSFTTALQATVVKRVTSDMKAIDLVYYNQVMSLFGVFFLVWASGELPGLKAMLWSLFGTADDYFDSDGKTRFIFGVLITVPFLSKIAN
jgi:GDP-fucose transporter C1